MSGNRANAAARNRRAGGAPEMQPPQRGQVRPGQQQQQKQLPPQQLRQPIDINSVPGAPKQMTIQNAVALMSIRMGRLETFMQKMEGENQGSDENSRIVDDGVFNSIVSRLDALERGHKLLTTKSATTDLPIPSKDSEKELLESVAVLKTEVSQLKDLLLQLQAFTMTTNQKLLDVAMSHIENENENENENNFQEQAIFLDDDHYNNNVDAIEKQDYAGQDLIGALNVSLKDVIENELSTMEE